MPANLIATTRRGFISTSAAGCGCCCCCCCWHILWQINCEKALQWKLLSDLCGLLHAQVRSE